MDNKDKEKQVKSCKNCVCNTICDKKLELKYFFDNHDCEHYQPKLPENSVVLSKEEYYELKQAKTLLEISKEEINYLADANIRYGIALENKGKETAEKIIAFIETLKVKEDGRHQWREDHNNCIDKITLKLNQKFINCVEIKE